MPATRRAAWRFVVVAALLLVKAPHAWAQPVDPSTQGPPPPTAPASGDPSTAPTPPPNPVVEVPADNAPPGPALAATPLIVQHPKFVDTARLVSGDRVLTLAGIQGLSGPALDGLQAYVASNGDRLSCQARDGDPTYVCLLPDGTDLAIAALLNGAARTTPGAPDAYRQPEAAAMAARRGLWANLPPPPVSLTNLTLADTATLVVNGERYVLDGVKGVGQPYADNLLGYIVSKGGSVTCQPRDEPGHYVCLLPDQEDVAEVALVNGAAEVAPNASDSYRKKQAYAMNNHLGIWRDVTPSVIEAFLLVQAPPPDPAYVILPEEASDGITYVAGVPEAIIAGETVALVYAGDAGWGYYGPDHDWHRAPDRYWRHMDHYHPDGRGLRGWHEAAYRHGDFHGGVHPGEHGPEFGHPGGQVDHPGDVARGGPVGGHPGFASTEAGHPGVAPGGSVHPAGGPTGGPHPGAVTPVAAHAGGGPATHAGGAPAYHAQPGYRSAATPAFHSAPAFHPAPAFHAAPSVHAAPKACFKKC